MKIGLQFKKQTDSALLVFRPAITLSILKMSRWQLIATSAIFGGQVSRWLARDMFAWPTRTDIKAAKYEIQKPSTCRATLSRCKFWSMFPVFHLARSTCRATKTFVAGWRKLLRKVGRGSTLSNKFYLALLLAFHQTDNLSCNKFARALANQLISAQPATRNKRFCCVQVDHARWKTRNNEERYISYLSGWEVMNWTAVNIDAKKIEKISHGAAPA